MTRDEILNMPAGREMDALMATEIMGWKVDDLTATSPSGSTWSRTVHGDDDWLPYYSTDETDAFTVVDKLAVEPIAFALDSANTHLGRVWWAGFWSDEIEPKHYRAAETVPLAICRSALILQMVINKVVIES